MLDAAADRDVVHAGWRSSDAAKLTACCADPHWRSIVVAGVSIGSPACSQALRPTLYDCSPYC